MRHREHSKIFLWSSSKATGNAPVTSWSAGAPLEVNLSLDYESALTTDLNLRLGIGPLLKHRISMAAESILHGHVASVINEYTV